MHHKKGDEYPVIDYSNHIDYVQKRVRKKPYEPVKRQLPITQAKKKKKDTHLPSTSSGSRSSSRIRNKKSSSTPSSQKKADGFSKPPPHKIDREDLRDRRATDANIRKAKLDAEHKVVLQAREK